MWKKIGALLLCALMILGSAMAEEKTTEAWRITVDGVELTVEGETVALNPSLEMLAGRDEAGTWLQLAVVNGGSNALAVQLEYAPDAIRASADGAKDVLVIDAVEQFLNQYGLTPELVNTLINQFFTGLETADTSTQLLEETFQNLKLERVGDREYRVSYADGNNAVSVHILWEAYDGGRPFDLSEKNACRYTFREVFPGDGTDIPQALTNAAAQLMADESVQALMMMFQLPSVTM